MEGLTHTTDTQETGAPVLPDTKGDESFPDPIQDKGYLERPGSTSKVRAKPAACGELGCEHVAKLQILTHGEV